MALQLSISTEFGITLATAYAKIISYQGNKDAIVIDVGFFATQAARDAGSPMVKRQAYQWNNGDMAMTSVTDVDGLVAALYIHLKTLPDFADAVDV